MDIHSIKLYAVEIKKMQSSGKPLVEAIDAICEKYCCDLWEHLDQLYLCLEIY